MMLNNNCSIYLVSGCNGIRTESEGVKISLIATVLLLKSAVAVKSSFLFHFYLSKY